MALLRQHLDYTDKDFDSLRARLHNLVDSAFPDWTEKEVANFANILLELFAFVGDVLLFYQDSQAGESRLSSAQLRRSLISAAKLVGYRPSGAAAAHAELTFQLAAPPAGSVTIQPGDRFSTLEITDPVVFQATEQVVITAGQSPPIAFVPLENSEGALDVFQSTGKPNQELTLGRVPFLDGSLEVEADDGAYEVVDDFLESDADDRHAVVLVDENDRARLRFGNGVSGAIPQGAIEVAYKVGGGKRGNVEPATIRKALRSYSDSLGNPVQVSVTNEERATDGDDRQTTESIRAEVPRSTRALTRTVAREDFETNALRVAGVARALMLTSDQVAGIDENAGNLAIVPAGGGNPSQALKDEVAALLAAAGDFPHTLTFRLSVVDPSYKAVDVHAVVFPTWGAGTPALNASLGASIRAALATMFSLELDDGSPNPGVDFGINTDGLIAKSDVANAIRDVAGVRRLGDGQADLLLNGATEDVEVEAHELPQLGTVTLINGYSAQAM